MRSLPPVVRFLPLSGRICPSKSGIGGLTLMMNSDDSLLFRIVHQYLTTFFCTFLLLLSNNSQYYIYVLTSILCQLYISFLSNVFS